MEVEQLGVVSHPISVRCALTERERKGAAPELERPVEVVSARVVGIPGAFRRRRDRRRPG